MPPKSKPKYVKKDHIEHILTRADMYVGSIRSKKTDDYVAIEVENGEYRIVKDKIEINPALLRIFIEALSNAIDNVKRSESTSTKCTKIKVNIDKINEMYATLDDLIKKERIKNRELKRKLGIVESKTNSSNEMIGDYNKMYDYDYLRNWALFLSIITSGIIISFVFTKQNTQIN